jgi:hypothetical protein
MVPLHSRKGFSVKLRSISIAAVIATAGLSPFGNACGQERAPGAAANDSIYTVMLIDHLRANFDDIHDVSMRFHHLDHRLNGMIRLRMHWENGRMISSSVALNETNNEDLARALVRNIEKWNIPGLKGPFDIELPLRIRIVGSDDSTFSRKGILTGEIRDDSGRPVRNVRLSFRSAASPGDTLRACYSNREGIFVKTLIPPGEWNVECAAAGYETVTLRNTAFKAGDHIREKITLRSIVRTNEDGGQP